MWSYPDSVLECVPNVSEGRDPRVLVDLAAACSDSLLDLHTDPDHHRSVFTLAGPTERDAEHATRELARAVRASDGGLPGVRALGLPLATRARAQVSMNLVDLSATGLQDACETVRALARAHEADVARVEVVGLLPASELARCDDEFRAWSRVGPEQTIEAQLALRLA